MFKVITFLVLVLLCSVTALKAPQHKLKVDCIKNGTVKKTSKCLTPDD